MANESNVMDTQTNQSGSTVLERLRQAINAHDLEAMAACFHPDYESSFPAHPDRAFRGHDQMRKNWAQIFGAIPDIETTLLRSAVEGDTVWSEWEWKGTRRDGSPHVMRGVTIQGVEGNRIAWARLFMEPVQEGVGGIDAAVQRTMQ